MKTIIAGSRQFSPTSLEWEKLDNLRDRLPITEVVSRMAPGADLFGLRWANSRAVPVRRFYANWRREGKLAGPNRNERMARCAEACILFSGGSGIADMRRMAKKHNLRLEEL